MMNELAKRAQYLISQGEGQFVEFKKKANHPDKIVKEVVAFANSGGGNLFIGVSDDGKITGLKYPEDEEYVVTKAIAELSSPQITFEVCLINFKEVRFLHYIIEEGTAKPYFSFLKKNHRYGKSFIRVADQSIQTSYEMRQYLKKRNKESQPIIFEEQAKELFSYFLEHKEITLDQYVQLSGLDKKLASKKLIDFALSGALKIVPKEGGDLFIPVE